MKQKLKANRLTMLLFKDARLLEYEPKAQYAFNRSMVILWLINMPLVLVLLLCFPHIWLKIELTYVTEISLWSLVEGHFGNMSSCLAAMGSREEDEPDS